MSKNLNGLLDHLDAATSKLQNAVAKSRRTAEACSGYNQSTESTAFSHAQLRSNVEAIGDLIIDMALARDALEEAIEERAPKQA